MTNRKNMLPSPGLTAALDDLRNMHGSPADLAARTGELVARYDSEWQQAHNRGEAIEQPVVNFLTAVIVHVDSLAATGQLSEAVTTMLFGLLSADIAKADIRQFEGLYIRGLHMLAMLLISMADSCPAQECAGHLDVCARYGLVLFSAFYGRYRSEGGAAINDGGMEELYGQVAGSGMTGSLPQLHGEAPCPLEKPGEIFVDILARLRACGLASI